MELFLRSAVPVLTLIFAFAALPAQAETIQAALTGYQENPPVSTVAGGQFRGFISRDDQTIDYELTYSGLQGTVTQAHIHFGQLSVNGSVVIWLCNVSGNNPPAGTQACPQSGNITGRITSSDVIAASTASQQLSAGELAEVIAAIRAGAAYVNVHTSLSSGGEIRGQIRASAKR